MECMREKTQNTEYLPIVPGIASWHHVRNADGVIKVSWTLNHGLSTVKKSSRSTFDMYKSPHVN